MMTLFKEMVQQDIQRVFLNPGEFGEPITLEGKQLVGIVDSLEMEWPSLEDDARPISFDGVELHVSLQDFPDKLWQGKPLRFNDETWHVAASNREALRCIRLYRERGKC